MMRTALGVAWLLAFGLPSFATSQTPATDRQAVTEPTTHGVSTGRASGASESRQIAGQGTITGKTSSLRVKGATGRISLIPVGASGPYTIEGNEIILGGGGVWVFLEVRVANWDPDQDGSPLLRGFQGQLDSSGFRSAMQGTMSRSIVPCILDAECEAALGTGSMCALPFANECLHGFVDASRSDFVFFGLDSWTLVTLDTSDYEFGAMTQSEPFAADPGVPTYGGTLVMEISPDSVGTFTVGFIDGLNESVLLDENLNSLPRSLSPALITIEVVEVPAVSGWGVLMMTLVFVGAAAIIIHRRNRNVAL